MASMLLTNVHSPIPNVQPSCPVHICKVRHYSQQAIVTCLALIISLSVVELSHCSQEYLRLVGHLLQITILLQMSVIPLLEMYNQCFLPNVNFCSALFSNGSGNGL